MFGMNAARKNIINNVFREQTLNETNAKPVWVCTMMRMSRVNIVEKLF